MKLITTILRPNKTEISENRVIVALSLNAFGCRVFIRLIICVIAASKTQEILDRCNKISNRDVQTQRFDLC